MKSIQISDIVSAVSGTLLWGEETALVDHVVIDSRQADEGALFVPIIGERVDAHRFIPDVLEQGAACTFSSDPDIRGESGAGIYVPDTIKALQDFAAWYRNKFDLKVIGITGSVGKTTTKEMISAALKVKYRTLKTIGNLNSQIGLSLMMFHIEDETELAVFEMGISMPGEMDRLVEIARPQTAVLTNVGVSHIGNLGSRENICAEKGKILTNFGDDGVFYVCGNGDLEELTKECIPYDKCRGKCQTVYYGTDQRFSYYGDQIQTVTGGQQFVFHYPGGEEPVELSVMGEHNVNNAVVALALALQYGVSLKEAKKALKAYRPLDKRGVVREAKGYYVVDDTYNASPDSINSNLHALFDYGEGGGKIAVLGDVLELGEQSFELHEGIGKFIVDEDKKKRTLSFLVTVGTETKAIHDYVREHSEIEAVHCDDKKEAVRVLRDTAKAGDWILVKGSRGMHMDEIVEELVKE